MIRISTCQKKNNKKLKFHHYQKGTISILKKNKNTKNTTFVNSISSTSSVTSVNSISSTSSTSSVSSTTSTSSTSSTTSTSSTSSTTSTSSTSSTTSTSSVSSTTSTTSTSSVSSTSKPSSTIPITTFTFFSTPTPSFISIIPIFTDQNRIDALNIQNIERRIKNVKDFTWSNIMETEAINWSRNLAEYNDCGLKHSLDTARGQNLYAVYGSTKSNINNAINAWVDEKKLIDNPNVTFNEIGHYLSIISPKFTQVGCGIAINPIQNCLVATCNYI